jgi:hypothetical protein
MRLKLYRIFHTFLYHFQNITLLTTVERYLGSMDEWPLTILETLFVENPPPRILKMLVAFFYGNGAPCPLASQLYNACNDNSAEDTQTFYDYYALWDRSPLWQTSIPIL